MRVISGLGSGLDFLWACKHLIWQKRAEIRYLDLYMGFGLGIDLSLGLILQLLGLIVAGFGTMIY